MDQDERYDDWTPGPEWMVEDEHYLETVQLLVEVTYKSLRARSKTARKAYISAAQMIALALVEP
jgi:hypothetical protein